jgi:hypothetical protein
MVKHIEGYHQTYSMICGSNRNTIIDCIYIINEVTV